MQSRSFIGISLAVLIVMFVAAMAFAHGTMGYHTGWGHMGNGYHMGNAGYHMGNGDYGHHMWGDADNGNTPLTAEQMDQYHQNRRHMDRAYHNGWNGQAGD